MFDITAQFVIIFCSQKYDLQKHTESVHEKCKLQKCSICGFHFYQKGNLKVHIGSVHEQKKSYQKGIFISRIGGGGKSGVCQMLGGLKPTQPPLPLMDPLHMPGPFGLIGIWLWFVHTFLNHSILLVFQSNSVFHISIEIVSG